MFGFSRGFPPKKTPSKMPPVLRSERAGHTAVVETRNSKFSEVQFGSSFDPLFSVKNDKNYLKQPLPAFCWNPFHRKGNAGGHLLKKI